VIWSSLRDQRPGIAGALLRLAPPPGYGDLLGAAIQLSACALVADGAGEIDDAARIATEAAIAAWQEDAIRRDVRIAAAALLFPGSVLLALLAPGSGQSTLLSALAQGEGGAEEVLPQLCRLAATLAHTPVLAGGVLRPGHEVLASLLTAEAWQEEMDKHRERVEDWRKVAAHRQLRYAAATDVWHAMLRIGSLGRMLDIVAADRAGLLAEVQRDIDLFDFETELRRIEPQVRGAMQARNRPIVNPALNELMERAGEATELIRRWVTLRSRAPVSRARRQPAAVLRETIAEALPRAREEVEALAGNPAEAEPLAIAILERIAELLNGRVPGRRAATPNELLNRDLLPVLPIVMEPDWSWTSNHLEAAVGGLLVTGKAPPAEAEVAIRARIDNGDFAIAEVALGSLDEHAMVRLRTRLGEALAVARGEETAALEASLYAVEEAERTGRIETGLAQEHVEELRRLRELLLRSGALDLSALRAEVRRHREQAGELLRAASAKVHERILERLDALLGRPTAEDRRRVNEMLEAGQFAIAEDLLERLEAGDELGSFVETPRIEPLFDAFFPARADLLAAALRGGNGLLRNLRHAEAELLGDLPSPALLERAAALGNAWAACAAPVGSLHAAAVTRLASELGFTDPTLLDYATPRSGATEALFRLHTRPLRDRATAVLPEFGSLAEGSYNLLCLWRKREAAEIAEAMARHKVGGGQTLVLFFGVLDVRQRRQLAALARESRLRSALVIDDVLVLHLALTEGPRLPVLCACTLPFSDSRPWADIGTPAPEMFFGRDHELRAVQAIAGDLTHLIYGGRQLGKTALMQQARRQSAETQGTVACYIGIGQVGLTRPPIDLWSVMADDLSKAGVPFRVAGKANPAEQFRRDVRDWLAQHASGHILLLLDEADAFFQKDREGGFTVTEAMRTLAAETHRRFKPVFAGLRNVQKLARDPNSPLAHFGQPLVIGPLLRGREREQAEALVRWPFAALGFRMDQVVATRILTFANYYPSLIQVVCQRLLRRLRERQGGLGPPWTIGIEDVEQVLEGKEIRDAAFERFRITLELDQRYNLLTLITAQLCADDPKLLAGGIEISVLRDLASYQWPAGFPADFGEYAFTALLDEMVGLGLLRQVDRSHVVLRSANLMHLIGKPEEIAADIDGFRTRPAPEEPDPLEQRRELRGGGLSALTARQEAELLEPRSGALVIAGLELAGIGQCEDAILQAVQYAQRERGLEVRARRAVVGAQRDRVLPELQALADRKSKGLEIFVVNTRHTWAGDWVAEAARITQAGRRGNTRVVFIADAARALAWAAAPERGSPGIEELTVGPWSRGGLLLWEATAQPACALPDWAQADPGPALAATGGWGPMLLRLAAERPPLPSDGEAALAAMLQAPADGVDPFADLGGQIDALRVLSALAMAEDTRQPHEVVNAALVAGAYDGERLGAGLAWAELVGVVAHGEQGLVLNRLIRAALPRLREAAGLA